MKEQKTSVEKTSKASFGAFALSLLIHGAALVLVGGYVIFEGIVPKTPFLPADVGMAGEAEEFEEPIAPTESLPETPATSGEVMEMSASDGESASTPSDLIVSAGVNPSFSLAPAVGPPAAVPKLGGGPGGGAGQKSSVAGPAGLRMSTLFGSAQSTGGSLTGRLYDLKQLKDGRPAKGMGLKAYQEVIREFTDSGWNPSKLEDYFKAERKLYATQFFIPLMPAEKGPETFEVGDKVKPQQWIIHYQGEWTPAAQARFRFVGAAGEILVVRFGGKTVLDGSHSFIAKDKPAASKWVPTEEVGSWRVFPPDGRWADERLVLGDWITVNPGQSYPMEVLIGERGGGDFYAFLLVEGLGPKPREMGNGVKAYPIFSTSPEGAGVPSYDSKNAPAIVP